MLGDNLLAEILEFKTHKTSIEQPMNRILRYTIQLREKTTNLKIKQFLIKQLQTLLQINYSNQKQIQIFLAMIIDQSTIQSHLQNQLIEHQVYQGDSYLDRFIDQQNKYTYIKLSQNSYFMINQSFIMSGVSHQSISLIITEFSLISIVRYLKLCIYYNQIITIATSTQLWQHYILPILSAIFDFPQQTISMVWKHNQNLWLFQQNQINQLTDDANIVFKRKFWHELTFDIILIGNNKKYLIRGRGINDEEILYSAWRRDIISEESYCQLIDKVASSNSEEIKCEGLDHQGKYYPLQIDSQVSKQQSNSPYKYRVKSIIQNLGKCQLFIFIPISLMLQIFSAGCLTEHCKSSVIYKKMSTQIQDRKFHIILKGKCKVNDQQIIGQGQYFNVQDFIEYHHPQTKKQAKDECESVTALEENTLIFSIEVRTLCFLLGHFQTILIGIHQIDPESQQIKQLKAAFNRLNITVSELLLQSIIYDSHANQKTASTETYSKKLLVGETQMKISANLWRILIRKNMKLLFLSQKEK